MYTAIDQLKDFQDKLVDLIQKVETKKVKNAFQEKLTTSCSPQQLLHSTREGRSSQAVDTEEQNYLTTPECTQVWEELYCFI